MNDIQPCEMDLATQRDVIALCDYETCPTIKSNNEVNTRIVVKSDGNSHSIKAGRNHGSDNHYKSLVNRAVGGAASMSKDQPAPLSGQSDKIVQVENLSKKYGENIAVNGISFSLTKGEVFAFLGPNGAR